jgi:DUF1680 family protein
MSVRMIEANPYVEETRNEAAVMRGPLVYCLESPDLPKGVRVLDVRLPRDLKLSTRAGDGPVKGLVIVEGKALAAPQGEWSGKLYRDLQPADGREIDLKLVPYFAWGNRGDSEMSVWLPLGK